MAERSVRSPAAALTVGGERALWLPQAASIPAVLPSLIEVGGVEMQPAFSAEQGLLDTFDWRLHAAGLFLHFLRHAGEVELLLRREDDPDWQRRVVTDTLPGLAASLPPGRVSELVAPVIGNRRLLRQGPRRVRVARGALRDRRGKTRVQVELQARPRTPGLLLRVIPITGFDTSAHRLRRVLAKGLGARALRGEDPGAYPEIIGPEPGSPPRWRDPLDLRPEQRMDEAVRQALRHYTRIMALNVSGAAQGLDPEFLHDFRVGVRRTRSVLKQLGPCLPARRVEVFTRDFRWLGQATSGLRDLDVLMEELPGYGSRLSVAQREALSPLRRELEEEHVLAQEALAALLDSARFRRRWAAWQAWLETAPARRPGDRALEPCEVGARRAIARVGRKAYRLGDRIDHRSPPAALHELRKVLKNLRYIIDIFEEIIPRKHLKLCLRRLRRLQEALGEYQDLDVHGDAFAARAAALPAAERIDPEVMQALNDALAARGQAARTRALDTYAGLRELALHKHPFGR